MYLLAKLVHQDNGTDHFITCFNSCLVGCANRIGIKAGYPFGCSIHSYLYGIFICCTVVVSNS